MKILWLCNSLFSKENIKGTGSWLQPLAQSIHNTELFEIYNITDGYVKDIVNSDFGTIKQWVIPKRNHKKHNHVASRRTCEEIASIIKIVEPDLVHVWGTERMWASVYVQGYIKAKTILEIQGLIFAIEKFYYGGLTFREIIKCIRVKEVLMPSRTIFNMKKIFRKRGEIEKEYIKKFKYISTQSEWVRNQIVNVNPEASLYSTEIMLRESFYENKNWQFKKDNTYPVIFSSVSAAITYKGLHILLKALSILKNKYPNIRLKLAGNIFVGNMLMDGYSIYLKKLIKKEGLRGNIEFLGSIGENQIVNELLHCSVSVIPSFVETYCLAFAEALILGVPTVTSFAGAMPELATHNESSLFYNSTDYITCASYINQLISNKELAMNLSANARKSGLQKNNINKVVQTQLSIYEKVMGN